MSDKELTWDQYTDPTARDYNPDCGRFVTLAGSVVTPTAISDKVRVGIDGVRYVLGNADGLVVAFSAAKAWRIRTYLKGM